MKRSGIIVAVESYLLRKGVVSILNRIPGVTVIREFDSLPPLEKFIQTRKQDLLLMSQSLFETAVNSLFKDGDLQERCILLSEGFPGKQGGGLPVIHTGQSKEEIMERIQKLLDAQPHSANEAHLFNLSPREKTIVRLVSLGYTNKQIAEELFLSAHTVITHRKNISHKLGIKSVSALTVYAIVNNIITIEEVNSKPL